MNNEENPKTSAEAFALVANKDSLKEDLKKAKKNLREANAAARYARQLKRKLESHLYLADRIVDHKGAAVVVYDWPTMGFDTILLKLHGFTSNRIADVTSWKGAQNCGIAFRDNTGRSYLHYSGPADIEKSLDLAKDWVAFGKLPEGVVE